MANKSSNQKTNKAVSFVKYFFINFISFIVVFPLFDLIVCAISQKEFQYNVVSHIVSPAVWAVLFAIFETIWAGKNKKEK